MHRRCHGVIASPMSTKVDDDAGDFAHESVRRKADSTWIGTGCQNAAAAFIPHPRDPDPLLLCTSPPGTTTSRARPSTWCRIGQLRSSRYMYWLRLEAGTSTSSLRPAGLKHAWSCFFARIAEASSSRWPGRFDAFVAAEGQGMTHHLLLLLRHLVWRMLIPVRPLSAGKAPPRLPSLAGGRPQSRGRSAGVRSRSGLTLRDGFMARPKDDRAVAL
jgi:hypothetical protein